MEENMKRLWKAGYRDSQIAETLGCDREEVKAWRIRKRLKQGDWNRIPAVNKICSTCMFSAREQSSSQKYNCDYIGQTGHPRPCKAPYTIHDKCDCYQKKRG